MRFHSLLFAFFIRYSLHFSVLMTCFPQSRFTSHIVQNTLTNHVMNLQIVDAE